MKTAATALVLISICGSSTSGQKMTYVQAKQRIPKQTLPPFWATDLDRLGAGWAKLQRGTSRVVARSPSGRALYLITFGPHEEVKHLANFNSAIGAHEPAAYMDKAKRTRPVIYFVGPVHGQETEGLVGLANLIEIMETGRDLRDRPQPTLRRLGDQCRLLILPSGNPDGLARFEPKTSRGMTVAESEFWGMGTWADDRIAMWPGSKRLHPHLGPTVAYLGCYFNDRGINPMHDEFFAPMGPEAPAILEVARQEGPDLAVSLHSHSARPTVLRPAYVPMEIQQEVRALSQQFYELLEQAGLPHNQPPQPAPERGEPPAPFNLISAIYHTCGANVFTFESPRGVIDPRACHVDFEQMLDIHLRLFEAMMRRAVQQKRACGLAAVASACERNEEIQSW